MAKAPGLPGPGPGEFPRPASHGPDGNSLPPELRNLKALTVCFEADLAPNQALGFVEAAREAALESRVSLSVNLLANPDLLPELRKGLFAQWPALPRVKANLGLAWAGPSIGESKSR